MSIGRTTLLLAPLAVVARAVAFFVPVFIAHWYGVQSATDAFYWAMFVPTFLLILGGTTMGTVLVPVLARLRVTAPERVSSFVGAAATVAVGLVTTLGVAFALTTPLLLPYLTGFDTHTQALTAQFAWALVPLMMAVAVAAVFKAACEVHGRFSGPAGAPVVRALTNIAVVGVFQDHGALVLAAGALCGGLAEVSLLAAVLWAEGIHPRPSFTLPPELAEAGRAFGPVLGGETLVAMNFIIDKLFAGGGPEGSVSLLEYADRARMIPQTLLESTLLVVAFNAWAAARARGEDAGRQRAVATTLWWVCLLAPPVLAGMAIGREALVRLIYENGAFTVEHTRNTSAILGAFLPGVFFSLLGALISKAHIVAGRFRLLFALGALSFTLNIVLNTVLMPGYGLVGLAWGTTITTAVVTLISFYRLLPDLRGYFPTALAWNAAALAGVSGALTLLAVARGFSPLSVTDPWLWVASLPFLGLLGAGAVRARRSP